MFPVMLLVWLLSGVVVIWLQFKYRDAGYPRSLRWRSALFVSGFICGSIGLLMFTPNSDDRTRFLTALFTGVFGGVIFAFGFPHQMRGLFPKR
jgi:RsiW-degrading membrane proteinase PrsW (M82 family)